MFSRLNLLMAVALILPLIVYWFYPGYEKDLGFMTFSVSRWLGITTFVMVYVVASVGLNIQTGFAGQLNLGYAGFMAVGAYAAAIWQVDNPEFVEAHEFLTVIVCLLRAFMASAVVGLLVCLPTLRLRGDYFAIVTFGFAELVRQVIKNERTWTGGANGLPNLLFMPQCVSEFKTWVIAQKGENLALYFDVHTYVKYLFFIVVVALTLWGVTLLRDSHFGRALFALRENPTAAEACGISLTYAKTGAFFLSAGLGGVAGYMYIILTSIASPDDYTFMISVFVVCLSCHMSSWLFRPHRKCHMSS